MEQRQSLAATAQARVEQARSQLSSAENNLAYTELRADTDGVVTAVQAEVGQVMAQGQGVVRVARTDELEIVVGVPEHRLKTVREVARRKLRAVVRSRPAPSPCGCASCRPAPIP